MQMGHTARRAADRLEGGVRRKTTRTDHVKNAISLSRLLSSSSIKCAWCKILPRECIVGATGCRGRSPTPVVRPCRGTDSPPAALMPGNEDGGA